MEMLFDLTTARVNSEIKATGRGIETQVKGSREGLLLQVGSSEADYLRLNRFSSFWFASSFDRLYLTHPAQEV